MKRFEIEIEVATPPKLKLVPLTVDSSSVMGALEKVHVIAQRDMHLKFDEYRITAIAHVCSDGVSTSGRDLIRSTYNVPGGFNPKIDLT